MKLSVQGFADQREKRPTTGKLAQDRSDAVADAIRGKGVDTARITVLAPGGATTSFTDGTSGPAAAIKVTDEQDEEANRRGNRVVTVTFDRVAVPVVATPPTPAPGP